MSAQTANRIAQLLRDHEPESWPSGSASRPRRSPANAAGSPIRSSESSHGSFSACSDRPLRATGSPIRTTPAWQKVTAMLSGLSQSRARQGFTPSQTASFVFSLKTPIFRAPQTRARQGPDVWLRRPGPRRS